MNELVQRTMGELCFESELDKFRQSEDPQESNRRGSQTFSDKPFEILSQTIILIVCLPWQSRRSRSREGNYHHEPASARSSISWPVLRNLVQRTTMEFCRDILSYPGESVGIHAAGVEAVLWWHIEQAAFFCISDRLSRDTPNWCQHCQEKQRQIS